MAIEKVEKSCPFSNFEDNAVPVVAPSTVSSGKMLTIIGTYFIKGVPVPNQAIAIHKKVFTQIGDRKITKLGRDLTDNEGDLNFGLNSRLKKVNANICPAEPIPILFHNFPNNV